MTLVNDIGRPLSDPCKTTGFFTKGCTERDYASWRRTAVDLRGALQSGSYANALELHDSIGDWLASWAKAGGEIDPRGIAFEKAKADPDPMLPEGFERFPEGLPRGLTPGIWSGLYAYLKQGDALWKKAKAQGAVKATSEVRETEKRLPRKWVKRSAIAVGIAGVIGIGAAIVSAVKRKEIGA